MVNLMLATLLMAAPADLSARAAFEQGTFLFKADRFEEVCEEHLSHLDEVAHEFFGSDVVIDAIQQKVESLYPEHEVDEFAQLFWQRIQTWRQESAA